MKMMFDRTTAELHRGLIRNGEELVIEETTRCVCGFQDVQNEESAERNLYIQCDHCLVWQHGACVGFRDEKSIPEIYYCEICRPDLHHVTYKAKAPPTSKYHQSSGNVESEWKSSLLKKRWTMNSRDAIYDSSLPEFDQKIFVEKASSEPIISSEKESDFLNKRKKRRNSDFPELSSYHEVKRIRRLSVSPRISLNTQSNDWEEEQATLMKKRKRMNMGIEVRKVAVKGRQGENKNKTKASEKKMKNVSLDNSDVAPNSSKTKQASLKVNAQSNANQLPHLEQKARSKAKAKKTSTIRHQHDTRQSQIQKDSEQTFSNVLNIIDKPSRPRIPQAKITMIEMKKRVAAILEYISRTQLEMVSDEEHRRRLFVPLLEKIDKEIKDKKENFPELDKKKITNSDSSKNNVETSSNIKTVNSIFHYNFDSFEMMENLTKQLLEWEEKFGSYRDKNS
ncbi:hypothetical protein PNEG_00995 [Pneumocystis murina B123]|uniref:Zinc finger PHD-type domain-containing protein n=1 Tax=Pneumocystis murina (strain B123) TaxID=1069680 RepID=M7PK75_PNEMU|nr:hypothetical protein PNEG_00995 [Pneumocystis murina B123]EMR10849.1 hypothetical protein PNEG_00995 [Pneumocystis murina B123]